MAKGWKKYLSFFSPALLLGNAANLVNKWVKNLSNGVSRLVNSSPAQNWLKGVTGSGLTQSDIEQNQWNADEAQKARDWEEYMQSTNYQRVTGDMAAAGLNPAMMYGQGVGVSTPSGASASGSGGNPVSAGALDSLLNVVFAQQRLRNMKADEENTKKDTELKGSQIEINTNQVDQIKANIDKLVSETKLNEEQTANVAKVTSWLDEQNQSVIDLQGAQTSYFRKQVDEIDAKIRNFDADTAKKWQEILNLRQEICESLHRIELIDQQAIESSTRASINVDTLDEIASRIKVLDQQADLFAKQSGLSKKQQDWYWVDHGLIPGLKIVGTAVGAAAGAGMFAGSIPYAGFTPSYMGR